MGSEITDWIEFTDRMDREESIRVTAVLNDKPSALFKTIVSIVRNGSISIKPSARFEADTVTGRKIVFTRNYRREPITVDPDASLTLLRDLRRRTFLSAAYDIEQAMRKVPHLQEAEIVVGDQNFPVGGARYEKVLSISRDRNLRSW